MNADLNNFNTTTWHYDHITKALKSTEGIQEFITYKLQTKPTSHSILLAKILKFKYFDIQFFTSFTCNKQTTFAHQIQFKEMLT